jgi:hypothetical protein
MLVASLRSRIRAANGLWERAVSDLTLEQVNHHERPGVLPIAFSLSHCIRNQDRWMSKVFLGEPPLWEQGGWATRIGVTVDSGGTTETVAQMEQLRFADLDAWRDYQSQVFARTDRTLDTITEETLSEVVVPSLPASSLAFCALVVGPANPVRKLEVLECFVFQHAIRHLGEVEHARALVGLTGVSNL